MLKNIKKNTENSAKFKKYKKIVKKSQKIFLFVYIA